MATAKNLEKIPGSSRGVRVNSAVRMIKLAQPICPNSKMRMVKDDTGKWVPAENQPENCQLVDPGPGQKWYDYCIEQGHNPYWTERVWYEPQDIVEEDADGNLVVTGTKKIKHTVKRPNISQVSASIRHNSGQGAKRKITEFGFKRLRDVGFEEVCQYRNCQRPLDPKWSGTNYGDYCSRDHCALIAANEESILLKTPDATIAGENYAKAQRARDKQIREALSGAF